jgi:hypothetical protein
VFTDVPPPPATPPAYLQDYMREDLFLRFDRRQALSRVTTDVGATRIDPETASDYSNPLIRFRLEQRLSSESALGLAYSRQYMDLGDELLAGVSDPTAPEPVVAAPAIPPDVASGDIFYSRVGEVYYNHTGRILGMTLDAYQRNLDYVVTPEDRIEIGGRALLSYNFTPTFSATAIGEALKSDYQNIYRVDRDVNYGMLFLYRINPQLSLSVEGRHIIRDSSDPLSSYTETRGIVGLLYASNPIFTPVARR